jgi:hypothetical protein
MGLESATSSKSASKEYKKALRHHLKSSRGRETAAAEGDLTPFRAAEKRYKSRFPQPDLCDVLDLALLDSDRAAECSSLGGWTGRTDALEWRQLKMKNGQTAFAIPSIPGTWPLHRRGAHANRHPPVRPRGSPVLFFTSGTARPYRLGTS